MSQQQQQYIKRVGPIFNELAASVIIQLITYLLTFTQTISHNFPLITVSKVLFSNIKDILACIWAQRNTSLNLPSTN